MALLWRKPFSAVCTRKKLKSSLQAGATNWNQKAGWCQCNIQDKRTLTRRHPLVGLRNSSRSKWVPISLGYDLLNPQPRSGQDVILEYRSSIQWPSCCKPWLICWFVHFIIHQSILSANSIAMRFDVRYDSLQLCISMAGIRFVVAIALWSGEAIVGVVVYRHGIRKCHIYLEHYH